MSRKRAESSLYDEPSKRASHKKTRFASPDEDPSRFEEDVEAGLEERSRKGRVKTEGYDSDSSDDGEGVVLSRKPGAAGAEDEDDDMFAAGDKKEVEESGKNKKEEFLRLGDIEGQVFDETNGEGVESGDDAEDEDVAIRRKAEMGFELTSFNMREEMEEGKFSSDGNYIRTFDPHAMHDKWMEDTDEKDIKKARKAKRKQEKLEQERVQAEERETQKFGGKEGMETEMLSLMRKGETVLEALARLGEKAKKAKEKQKSFQRSHQKSRNNKNSMDADEAHESETSVSSTSLNSQIDRLTSLASKLLDFGDVDIYDKTYEHLVRSVRSSGRMPQDWQPPSADPKYEYKWDVPGATNPTDIFGPYGEEEMKAWLEAQYFGPSGEKIKVRTVGGDWGDWDDVVG